MRLQRLPDRLWVLIAHEAGARIYARDDARLPLALVVRIDWPIGRAKNREINSDRPGREEDWSPCRQRHGFDQPTLPTEKNALDLARRISRRLDRAADLDEFDHLLIVAGPKFLGLLRRELGRAARARLALTLDENLAGVGDREITSRLRPLLSEYERSRARRAG